MAEGFNGNNKYRIHIDDDSPENLKKELIEVARILDGLRHYSIIWKEHYGAGNRQMLKRWEDNADRWISEHKLLIPNKNENTTKDKDTFR